MPRKPTAHAELDELRQQAATERVKARDLAVQLEAATAQVERGSAAIADGYAAEDQAAVSASREAEEKAIAQVRGLQHRLDGARLRVDRIHAQLDTFTRERARDLLAEREPKARDAALNLSRSVAETLAYAKAYAAERQADGLVAEVPGATPRADGPAATHPWEQALKGLEQVVRQAPELEPPLPCWHGLDERQQQGAVHRQLNQQRKSPAVATQP